MTLPSPPPEAGAFLGRTYGISMWPALRPGDLLFGHPLAQGERPPPGAVLVAEGPHGLIAHRLQRLTGTGASQRFFLSGDLSGADFPLPRSAIEAVATALYRARSGFMDVPGPLPHGPVSRRMVNRLLSLLLSAASRQTAAVEIVGGAPPRTSRSAVGSAKRLLS